MIYKTNKTKLPFFKSSSQKKFKAAIRHNFFAIIRLIKNDNHKNRVSFWLVPIYY